MTSEQALLRWVALLTRACRWPHPLRPWCRRQLALLLLVAADLAAMRRALDQIVADAQAQADAADMLGRVVRDWRHTKESSRGNFH